MMVAAVLCSRPAQADVVVGTHAIWRGTTWEITGPHPDLDIQAVIDSITDASESKPYLIKLGAGEYDLGTGQIVMKPYVSIQGYGQEATYLTTAASQTTPELSAVISGANNATLSDLTLINTGGSTYSIGIFNSGTSPRIERVSAIASGISNNYGVMNLSSSNPVMIDITATASGGGSNSGVHNVSSSPIMTRVTASASAGLNFNAGVVNVGVSSPMLTLVTSTGSGGAASYGVTNSNSTSPTLRQVTATASEGTTSYGLFSFGSSAAFIQDSVLDGTTEGLKIDSTATGTLVVNTMIVGGVVDEATATINCRGNYDENLASVDCDDPAP